MLVTNLYFWESVVPCPGLANNYASSVSALVDAKTWGHGFLLLAEMPIHIKVKCIFSITISSFTIFYQLVPHISASWALCSWYFSLDTYSYIAQEPYLFLYPSQITFWWQKCYSLAHLQSTAHLFCEYKGRLWFPVQSNQYI